MHGTIGFALWRGLAAGAALAAMAAVAGGAIGTARAADTGGSACCADLEARVAELEATVARKGNRRVSLTIAGEVSKAMLYIDGFDGVAGNNRASVVDPHVGRVRIVGESWVSALMSVGFLVELGLDTTRGRGLGLAPPSGVDRAVDLRRSAVWMETGLGRVTLGRFDMATERITEIDLSNANVASRLLTAQPVWSWLGLATLPIVGGNLLNPAPFHDLRGDVVRYDSSRLAGFSASASWANNVTATGGNAWDAAVRWGADVGPVRMSAGAGWRVEDALFPGNSDARTLSGSASMMHMPSGAFLTVSGAIQRDNPVFGDIRFWQVRTGLERRVMPAVGITTVFAEYGDHALPDLDVTTRFLGGGVVQRVDSAALDIFASIRRYDVDGPALLPSAVTIGLLGVRLEF